MTMNENNTAVVQGVIDAIDRLGLGTKTVSEVQSVLGSAVELLENDGTGIIDAVRLAEADLEEIRFATVRDEQVSAAMRRLNALREAIEGAIGA